MKITPGKKYRTKNGLSVEIYSVDNGGPYPVHGRIRYPNKRIWVLESWTHDGKFMEGSLQDDIHDLVGVTPVEFDWSKAAAWHNWLAMDADGEWWLFPSKPKRKSSSFQPGSDRVTIGTSIVPKKFHPNVLPGTPWTQTLVRRPR